MKYRTIIFDMDGTIVDSEHIWKISNKNLLEKRGVQVTPELVCELDKHISGLSLHKAVAIIKEVAQLIDHVDDLIAEQTADAHRLYEEHIIFIEGFTAFHELATKTHGLKTALATNADEHLLGLVNDKLNLKNYFGDHLYSISHVGNRCKPDPAVFLHAAQQLGVAPEHCVVIEDSAHGISAALAAGMHCIGIKTSKAKNQTDRAHSTIDRYDELCLKKLLKID